MAAYPGNLIRLFGDDDDDYYEVVGVHRNESGPDNYELSDGRIVSDMRVESVMVDEVSDLLWETE